jgi:2-C-methyl-D-erythritol 4-phosphate cytidylyltransferase
MAFNQGYKAEFTDDATVLEAAGNKVYLTKGNIENIKITTPHDLIIASTLLDNIE